MKNRILILLIISKAFLGCQHGETQRIAQMDGDTSDLRSLDENSDPCVRIIDSLESHYAVLMQSYQAKYQEIGDLDTLRAKLMSWNGELGRFIEQKSASAENRLAEHYAGKKALKRMNDIFVRRYMNVLKATPAEQLEFKDVMGLPNFTYGLAFTTLDEIEAKFSSLPADLQERLGGENAFPNFKKYSSLVGQSLANQDVLEDINGQTFSLHQIYQGNSKATIVFFGASWCAACRNAESWFHDWHPQLDGPDLQVLNLSIDKNPTHWRKSVVDDDLSWASYRIQEPQVSSLYRQLKLGDGIPIILLLDADHKVILAHNDIREIVKQLPNVRFETRI